MPFNKLCPSSCTGSLVKAKRQNDRTFCDPSSNLTFAVIVLPLAVDALSSPSLNPSLYAFIADAMLHTRLFRQVGSHADYVSSAPHDRKEHGQMSPIEPFFGVSISRSCCDYLYPDCSNAECVLDLCNADEICV